MRELRPVEKQWIFQPDTLENLPSSLHGIPTEKELKRRKQTIQYVRSLALRTNLCDAEDLSSKGARGVLTAAATLIHRFYMRRSFDDFSEELIAGTMLFLASKIEEEPLKLRHICNQCLFKFENDEKGGWHPTDDHGPPPSPAYRRWEKEILATEEIVLETLCFDMGIEQPWVVLRRSIRGKDALLLNRISPNGSVDSGNERRVTEDMVAEMGWTILNEVHMTPLPVLHPAVILAFMAFILVISLCERIPLSEATAIASELSERFDLDVSCDDSGTLSGSDLVEVQRSLAEFVEYCKMELIDPGVVALIPQEPAEPNSGQRIRRYQLPNLGTSRDIKPVTESPTEVDGNRQKGTGNGNGNETHLAMGQMSSPKPLLKSPAAALAQ